MALDPIEPPHGRRDHPVAVGLHLRAADEDVAEVEHDETADVVEGKPVEGDVGRVEVVPLRARRGPREECAVCVHDALRAPRAAGRLEEQRDVVGGGRGKLGRGARKIVEREHRSRTDGRARRHEPPAAGRRPRARLGCRQRDGAGEDGRPERDHLRLEAL